MFDASKAELDQITLTREDNLTQVVLRRALKKLRGGFGWHSGQGQVSPYASIKLLPWPHMTYCAMGALRAVGFYLPFGSAAEFLNVAAREQGYKGAVDLSDGLRADGSDATFDQVERMYLRAIELAA